MSLLHFSVRHDGVSHVTGRSGNRPYATPHPRVHDQVFPHTGTDWLWQRE